MSAPALPGQSQSSPDDAGVLQALSPQDWQRLWLAVTRNRRWHSLALVPAGSGARADFTLDVATSLARAGMMHTSAQIQVAAATELAPESTGEFLKQVRETMDTAPVILALPAISANPAVVPLAQSADSALLCIVMERMRFTDAKRTIEQIGRNHFVGAVTFT